MLPISPFLQWVCGQHWLLLPQRTGGDAGSLLAGAGKAGIRLVQHTDQPLMGLHSPLVHLFRAVSAELQQAMAPLALWAASSLEAQQEVHWLFLSITRSAGQQVQPIEPPGHTT